MKINIFEGSRRILRLLQIIYVGIVGIFFWLMAGDSYVYTKYATDSPSSGWVRALETFECESGVDAIDSAVRKTKNGTRVWATLCFIASPYPDGTKYVSYKESDDKKSWWGSTPYSEEVSKYKEKRAEF